MKISEIFLSISGESFEAGKPAVFIRAHGCSLRCDFCDSMYAVEGTDYKEMTVDEIVEEVKKFECKKVVFTGGEPLEQEDAYDLIDKLLDELYEIEIETNGAVDLRRLDSAKYHLGSAGSRLIITMDWKCPSSKMNKKMIRDNLYHLRGRDVIKFVVGTNEDLDEMKEISKQTKAQSFVSPVFGKIKPKEIVDYVLENKLWDVRVQLQIHKIIYPADMKGV